MALRVLIIEDNAEIRENTAEMLYLSGFETLTAENGEIGIELAEKHKPELIICDILMPGLNGYEVLKYLRDKPETASIPFTFLTAKSEPIDLKEGLSLGADDYLVKPFDEEDLLKVVYAKIRHTESFVRLKNIIHS